MVFGINLHLPIKLTCSKIKYTTVIKQKHDTSLMIQDLTALKLLCKVLIIIKW
jgi:hypothetical protein